MGAENAIEVEVLVVRREEFPGENKEMRALESLATRRGDTSSCPGGFGRRASLLLKLLVAQKCGGGKVQRSEFGKPFISGQPFCWNLSHDDELACVAFAPAPVGVDVEAIRAADEVRMAALGCAAPEVLCQWVREGSTEAERAFRFTLAWTATEAALKAEGRGFAKAQGATMGDLARWHYRARAIGGCLVTCACARPLNLQRRFVNREEISHAVSAVR